MTPRRRGLGVATILLWAATHPAGYLSSQENMPANGSSMTVRLVTVGPGTEVWERFGHNALWISDSLRNIDVAFDYGRFDFAEPGFLQRFVEGEMQYWMASSDPHAVIGFYRERGRSVWVQELELPPEAKGELYRFLTWNVLEENRYYRYDYYRDNCSTRLRDALDRVLDGAIANQTMDTVPESTWRYHSDRLLAPDVMAYTGTKLGLANPTDRPISRWDEMYVPMKLQEHLRTVQIVGESGQTRPLVGRELTIQEGPLGAGRPTPPGWYLVYLALGLAWAAVIVAAARMVTRGYAVGRIVYGLATGVWAAFAGGGGLLLVYLWFGTDHVMTRGNENLLQLSPLALPLLVLIPVALRKRVSSRAAVVLAGSVALMSVAGVLIKVLPGVDQANWQILALALPINVALGVTAWRLQPAAEAS